MSGNDKRPLIPKLRFPEFAGQRLREVPIKNVTAESTERNGDNVSTMPVMGVSKTEGIVPMEERLIASDISRYKIVQKDWFVYNPMRLNIGSIAQWKGEHNILVSPDYVVFKCLDGADFGVYPSYLNHFRQSEKWEKFVTEGGDGGVRVRIYYKDLARLQLALPWRDEQQKIADCLSSLDDLITAETRKLDALMTNKKGLMQQLFPCEGETLPRLRFPEFRDAREWKEVALSTQVDLISGLHLAPDEYSDTGEVPYFTGPSDYENDLSLVEKWTERGTNSGCAGDILITVKGSGVGELLYLELEEVAMGRQLMAVRPRNAHGGFVFHFLATQRQRLVALASGNLIPGLSRGDILGLKMSAPERDEQQKIAECLSSIDNLAAAQSKKIDALKAHKKSLMQQLFLAINEVHA